MSKSTKKKLYKILKLLEYGIISEYSLLAFDLYNDLLKEKTIKQQKSISNFIFHKGMSLNSNVNISLLLDLTKKREEWQTSI